MTPDFPPGPLPARPLLWFGLLRLWLWLTVLSKLFAKRARRSKRRPTHPLGVGASGHAVANPGPGVPTNPFFRPGRRFAMSLRHANLAREDDAMLDIRSASISLVDGADRLDLPMNTGLVSAFWDTTSFLQFVRANLKGKAGLQALLARSPRHHLGATCALVRAPGSYAELGYYAQLTYRWLDREGELWLVRYRLVPAHSEGSHLLDEVDRKAPWDHERREGENRRADYLRAEYAARLGRAPVPYRLQGQFQKAAPAGDPAYDSAVAWTAPWHALAEVVAESALLPTQTEALAFNIAHCPESLGYFRATRPDDPNALAYYRASIYARTQRIRPGPRRE